MRCLRNARRRVPYHRGIAETGVVRMPTKAGIALAMLCVTLAGCGGGPQGDDEPAKKRNVGLEALLAHSGGAPATGTAEFTDHGDGVNVNLFINNLTPGTFRFAVHATGNCSSSNFFSAGPVWIPPGSNKTVADLTPDFRTTGDGDKIVSFHLPGMTIGSGPNSVLGRSVVIHEGREISDAQPGVPNERSMCGVIGPAHSFFD
jgi:Cu-Zn family superoxide dismutase